jgi:hypothetical protein
MTMKKKKHIFEKKDTARVIIQTPKQVAPQIMAAILMLKDVTDGTKMKRTFRSSHHIERRKKIIA